MRRAPFPSPLKLGGLGLRDPTNTAAAARLASLINATELAAELGADPAHLAFELEAATAEYMLQTRTPAPPDLTPRDDLQAELCLPIFLRQVDQALRAANPTSLERLHSLSQPHATSWTLSTPLVKAQTPAEFRCGLRWILGMPLRASNYLCPYCGRQADGLGVHAVTCGATGDITRAHNALRDTVAHILTQAGYTVLKEQCIPGHPELRPADLLVLGYGPRPLALDFTVVTPVRASAPAGQSGSLLDTAARDKIRKYRRVCDRAGWDFLPFAADTFGAVRSDARSFVNTIIYRKCDAFAPLEPHQVGQHIWSAISSAAVQRAATQLARAEARDNPAGMPLGCLDLQGARAASERMDLIRDAEADMGTITSPLPSLPQAPLMEDVPFDLADQTEQPPTHDNGDRPMDADQEGTNPNEGKVDEGEGPGGHTEGGTGRVSVDPGRRPSR